MRENAYAFKIYLLISQLPNPVSSGVLKPIRDRLVSGLRTEMSISVYPNFISYVISRHCGTFFSGI